MTSITNTMKNLLLILLIVLSSCTVQRIRQSVDKSEIFNHSGFTGFMLHDPATNKTLHAVNEDIYFVPASNTKLFTFYTAYNILGDSVHALNVVEKGDSLIFWGTGDPSLLHPDFQSDAALNALRHTNKQLFFADNTYQVTPNGPGWSWSWYTYYFGAERSALPMYGNVVRFTQAKNDSLMDIYPAYFRKNIMPTPEMKKTQPVRDQGRNLFQVPFYWKEESTLKTDKPFLTSTNLTVALLEDALGKSIQIIPFDQVKGEKPTKVKGIASNKLYKQMMEDSDNFLAEQLMLLVSDALFDSLDFDAAVTYANKELLADLSAVPQWADGSGLSSNNKFTPRSIIELLDKIKKEVPEEEIFDYFPAGGSKGTISAWYKADEGERPYIYAKTGTLSNSICLSGYLLTKSGKTLYFSFLHNNYPIPADDLKREMERVLYQVHRTY
jgi:serine-type D-Ala-D-Ala carboxypeptidase/endopeptidase (penicillin-binding protein 4)